MTEKEWLAGGDPRPMVAHVRPGGSGRKLRLFACACAYRVYRADTDDYEREAVGVSERFADGMATAEELREVEDDVGSGDTRFSPADYACSEDVGAVLGAAETAVGMVEYNAEGRHPDPARLVAAERAAQADLLRDVFGNPFRTVALNPEWLTSTVVQLATGIYDEKAFDWLPILADALQDAGCDHDDVLTHCRGPGPHVRGCWVVDLVLGNE